MLVQGLLSVLCICIQFIGKARSPSHQSPMFTLHDYTFHIWVDKTLLSTQQKLLLFKLAICPHLTWDLSVNPFLVSWLESTLQPIATKFLKRWSGLAKSADTGCLFLPKEKGSLELPSLVSLYKKLRVAKAAVYTCCRDPLVRVIATRDQEGSHSDQISL